jgi:hypothetical protein
LDAPDDVAEPSQAAPVAKDQYLVQPRSVVLLIGEGGWQRPHRAELEGFGGPANHLVASSAAAPPAAILGENAGRDEGPAMCRQ